MDGHIQHFSSSLLIQNAVENAITIFRLPTRCTHTIEPLDEDFLGLPKFILKKVAAICKINRDRTASISRFALSKAVSVEVGVSLYESTGMYPFNGNRVLEYLVSISDTSETKPSMETASPNTTHVGVDSTKLTNALNMLPIRAETSLNSLSTLLSPGTSPEEITVSRVLKKISLLPEIPRS